MAAYHGCLLWLLTTLQLLTLAAFAMLPSAVGIDRHSPVTSRRAVVAPASEEAALAPSPPPSLPPSPPPSPPHDASTAGACAAGVSGAGSLNGTPLLRLPHMGDHALGEHRASSHATCATTDGGVDATPPRPPRSSYGRRAHVSRRPRRKFNLRFVALVKWDLACFLCSLLLFLAAVCTSSALPLHCRRAAAPPRRRAAAPPHPSLHRRTSPSLHPSLHPSTPPSLCTSAPLQVTHAAPSWESLLHSAEPWTGWCAARAPNANASPRLSVSRGPNQACSVRLLHLRSGHLCADRFPLRPL
jgi:hypothetical protein